MVTFIHGLSFIRSSLWIILESSLIVTILWDPANFNPHAFILVFLIIMFHIILSVFSVSGGFISEDFPLEILS